MILSDSTIQEYIADDKIVIEPSVEPEQIQPASLDVRLGGEYYDMVSDTTIDMPDVVLKPNTPYLGHTLDTIELPNDVCALLTGRSTLGRKGIMIHCTAGFIDPEFKGQITLEMYNLGSETVTLEPGSRIGQLIFFKLDNRSGGYSGQYQNQSGITKDGNVS